MMAVTHKTTTAITIAISILIPVAEKKHQNSAAFKSHCYQGEAYKHHIDSVMIF